MGGNRCLGGSAARSVGIEERYRDRFGTRRWRRRAFEDHAAGRRRPSTHCDGDVFNAAAANADARGAEQLVVWAVRPGPLTRRELRLERVFSGRQCQPKLAARANTGSATTIESDVRFAADDPRGDRAVAGRLTVRS